MSKKGVYDFVTENFEVNEPIFIYELDVKDKSENAVKLELRKLLDDNKLRKYDRGIYYIPGQGSFGLETLPNIEDVIEKRYLKNETGVIGYLTDVHFANQLSLSSQRPYAITTFYVETNPNIKTLI